MIGSRSTGPPALARARPSARSRVLRRLRRRRRLVAAVLLALATASAVHAVRPPAAPTTAVLTAGRDLPGGHRLAAADVAVQRLPEAAVPDGVLAASSPVDGRALAGPVRRGEVLTDARLSGTGLLVGAGPGLMAVPVAVDGALPPGLVAAGDAVAVLAGASASGLDGLDADAPAGRLLVRRAQVLVAPQADAGAGLLGGSGVGERPVVVLALDGDQAARVTGASGDRPLSLALLP